jgi:transposase
MKYFRIAIAGIVALVGLFALNDYVVSQQELQEFEFRTVQTLEQFQEKIQQQHDINRLDMLNDDYYRQKQRLRDHPDDEELKEDLDRTEKARDGLRQKLGITP